MAANVITLGRVFLMFIVVLMFQGGFYLRIAAVAMTIFIIYLDSLDGYIARKLGVASDFGALFDIAGDRIVEHIFLIFFTAMNLISFWVPVIFITRSFLVDTLRSVAFSREGKTPFGEKSMMRSGITYFLTASRFSRAVYGVSKVVAFVFLGFIIAFRKGFETGHIWISQDWFSTLLLVTHVLVWTMVAFNLLRGIPVLIDGRFYLFEKYLPRSFKGDS